MGENKSHLRTHLTRHPRMLTMSQSLAPSQPMLRCRAIANKDRQTETGQKSHVESIHNDTMLEITCHGTPYEVRLLVQTGKTRTMELSTSPGWAHMRNESEGADKREHRLLQGVLQGLESTELGTGHGDGHALPTIPRIKRATSGRRNER